MQAYYLLIVSFLFILAIALLIIGVSNDAVNFLNSAIGCKAASFKMIILIAAAGILIGAVSSNGMMEVARKGIFNPDQFAFNEIIIIFLSVMLTNVLLLDFFNTMGLPTSTTISIVFGLLGAAVSVSLIKIASSDTLIKNLESYINIGNSLAIIIGIFLSVVIAFNAGVIVQWFIRLAFTFNIKSTYKYWAGIWGGFAITAILYFLIIKGAKGSTVVSQEAIEFINNHTLKILLINFIGWSVIFQALIILTSINVIKITVLVGTFALAMAFAGNDLVNFIGVPLAGFESTRAFIASGSSNAGEFMMTSLNKPVDTPIFFLIAAGLIMVFTLRFSKKAKSVTATTLDLSRQSEGSERFSSSTVARIIVRGTLDIGNGISRITPGSIKKYIGKRFSLKKDDKNKEELSFDLVRASVNLVVASILISIGTSLKLPLSTTYVTFMVTMGTSLSDGAWGRDSAVYRITGVLTVIGGWFFTALSAFVASCILALVIYFGKLPSIILLIALSGFILFRTNILHKKREKETGEDISDKGEYSSVLKACDKEVLNKIKLASELLHESYIDFFKEKQKKLRHHRKDIKSLGKEIKQLREDIPGILKELKDTDVESGHHYVEVVTYLKEISNALLHLIQPAYTHLNNQYPLDKKKTKVLIEFYQEVYSYFKQVIRLLEEHNYKELDIVIEERDVLICKANDILFNRIKILKKTQKGSKESITYMEMLAETKTLILSVSNLTKAESMLQNPYLEESQGPSA